MRILVTGGFGFIGGHLVEALLREPSACVHVVDDLSSSPLPLDHLLREIGEHPNLSWSLRSVREFCESGPVGDFQEIYHLASVVGPAGVLDHSGEIVRKIVSDTYALMDLAERSGARLLHVSTSEIYGGGRQGLCSEGMPKVIPAACSVRLEYAVAKLAAEVALINRVRASSLDTVIVRPFNVCGPRQSGSGGFVLPRFVGQALAGLPLTIFGDGQQVRAFTHVQDMAEGMILAMRRGTRSAVYNLGNPRNRCTVGQLAESVIRIAGSEAGSVFVDPKTIFGDDYEDAADKYPDSRAAMAELGWRPLRSCEETVRDTVEYFRSLPQAIRERLSALRESGNRSTSTADAAAVARGG